MDFERERDAMVNSLVERGHVSDSAVEDALREVPRHEFVPTNRRREAYEDRPLPIGDSQTISAPHMVGAMLDLLELDPGEAVLEIGTGRGYHAAVTAAVVGAENVYTVEYSPALAERAREKFGDLGCGDVSVRHGDGHEGWPEHTPYDAAYMTCAAPDFPDAVVEQVRERGRLLGPLGERRQRLVYAEKRPDGLDRESHGGVRFVPMRGG